MRIRTCVAGSLPGLACVIVAVACTQPGTSGSDTSSVLAYPDSVFFNGRIYTVDDDRSWVEAVAIVDGRFLSTGTDEEMLSLVGPQTIRHDLAGAVAMPGLHDAHFHGMALYNSLDCSPPVFTPAQLRETLEYCVTRRVDGHPWLLINNRQLWDEPETVTNAVLYEVFPDIPVMMRDTSGHMRLVNAMALDAAGIDADTPDPDGGSFSDIRKRATPPESSSNRRRFRRSAFCFHRIPMRRWSRRGRTWSRSCSATASRRSRTRSPATSTC